jgi:hypothetical protein
MKPRPDKHLPIETEQVYRNVDGTVAVERITREPAVEARPGRPARRPSLAGLLVGAGLTTYEQITEALEEGLGTGERLGEVIVRRGWATEEDLAELLAEQWDLPYLDGATVHVDPVAIGRLPLERARELGALPVYYDGIELVVAVAEPAEDRFATVRETLDDVSFAVVGRSALERLLADPTARAFESAERPVPHGGESLRDSESLVERLTALLDDVEQLELRVQRAEERLESAYGQLERNDDTIDRLKQELALRDDLLEVLQAKLADL